MRLLDSTILAQSVIKIDGKTLLRGVFTAKPHKRDFKWLYLYFLLLLSYYIVCLQNNARYQFFLRRRSSKRFCLCIFIFRSKHDRKRKSFLFPQFHNSDVLGHFLMKHFHIHSFEERWSYTRIYKRRLTEICLIFNSGWQSDIKFKGPK